MSRPRVFVSSTYYDLKHVRASLESFIESLGFDPVLSEKGDIAYVPDVALDESCYREVGQADIFVIVIGGRYGAEQSAGGKVPDKNFYTRYDSITKGEYRAALNRDIPIYILVERSVYAEYRTFQKNKSNDAVQYAHVDSVNIFLLLEEILGQHKNNPVHEFDHYNDIEAWLRDQWAGYFKELLGRVAAREQIATMSSQISELAEVTKTLKRYLEEVVSRVAPQTSAAVIGSEEARLRSAETERRFAHNPFVSYLERQELGSDVIRRAIAMAGSADELKDALVKCGVRGSVAERIGTLLADVPAAQRDFERAREALGLSTSVSESRHPRAGKPPKPAPESAAPVTKREGSPPAKGARRRKRPT